MDDAIACTSLSCRRRWHPSSRKRARLLQPSQAIQALTRSRRQILGSQDALSFHLLQEELDNLVGEVGQAVGKAVTEEQTAARTMSLETPKAR